MTALPAPIPAGGSGPGDIPPVLTSADVLAVLPAYLKGDDPAPVRDGLVAALTAILTTYQGAGSYASGNVDVLRAEGSYLDSLGSDRKVRRASGEQDPPYRARIIGIPSLVTPAAILAGVNAALAPYTTAQAQYFESAMDRWYARSATSHASWRSFVWSRTTTAVRRCPMYLDRLYEDDAAANGVSRVQSAPGGARVFSDRLGRFLVLRIPDLSSVNSAGAFAFNTSKDPPATATPVYWSALTSYSTVSIGGAKYYLPSQANQTGYFYAPQNAGTSGSVEPTWPKVPGQYVRDGSVVWLCKGVLRPIGLGMYIRTKANGGTSLGTYVRARGASAVTVYAAIASLVDRIKGSSIRAAIFVDSTLR